MATVRHACPTITRAKPIHFMVNKKRERAREIDPLTKIIKHSKCLPRREKVVFNHEFQESDSMSSMIMSTMIDKESYLGLE